MHIFAENILYIRDIKVFELKSFKMGAFYIGKAQYIYIYIYILYVFTLCDLYVNGDEYHYYNDIPILNSINYFLLKANVHCPRSIPLIMIQFLESPFLFPAISIILIYSIYNSCSLYAYML